MTRLGAPIVSVRNAADDDAARLTEIRTAATQIVRTIYRPNLERLRGRPQVCADDVCLVASLDEVVVGTLTYSLEEQRLHLRRIAVDPNHHRRGVARALVEAAAQRAHALGACSLSLDTIRQTGNVEIFGRLGFEVVSEHPTDLFESDRFSELSDVRMERAVSSI